MKAGNAVILRGGKDSFHTSTKLCNIINEAFTNQGIPEHAVQMIPVTDRSAVDEMITIRFLHRYYYTTRWQKFNPSNKRKKFYSSH